MSLRRKLRNLGRKTKNAAKKVGSTVKKVTKSTGKAIKNGANKVGSAVKITTKKAVRAIKNTGKKVLKIGDFKLNCHFLICHSKTEFSDEEVEVWIAKRIAHAEKLYAMKPRLKIRPSFSRVKNGEEFLKLKFFSGKDYNAFMNKKFDNISGFLKKGKLHFLITEEWSIEGKQPCGKAFFMHYPGWKKHAIYLRRYCGLSTFSHELGHVFGLLHTFEKVGLCTRKYPKRKGGTKKNGRSNLMDYERENNVYINDCQERLAAATRRRLITVTGKVKYYKLSGLF